MLGNKWLVWEVGWGCGVLGGDEQEEADGHRGCQSRVHHYLFVQILDIRGAQREVHAQGSTVEEEWEEEDGRGWCDPSTRPRIRSQCTCVLVAWGVRVSRSMCVSRVVVWYGNGYSRARIYTPPPLEQNPGPFFTAVIGVSNHVRNYGVRAGGGGGRSGI